MSTNFSSNSTSSSSRSSSTSNLTCSELPHQSWTQPLPPNDNPESRAYPSTPERTGSLKLLLRVKRSPVLDDVIESGTNLSEDCKVETEYEVVPVESVTDGDNLETRPRKKHKSRDRERRHKRRNESTQDIPSIANIKRLKLIFGNESTSIDLSANSHS